MPTENAPLAPHTSCHSASPRQHDRTRCGYLIIALTLAFTVPVLHAAETPTYEQSIATAKACAATDSWDKAREAYAAALAVAPDDTAKRWCELWLNSIRQISPNHWWLDSDSIKSLQQFLTDQLAPYEKGTPRDELWVRLKTDRADLLSKRENLNSRPELHGQSFWSSTDEITQQRISWDDPLDVADYLSGLPATPEALHRYVQSLQRAVGLIGIVNRSAAAARMRAHLAKAKGLALDKDDLAWCLYAHARTSTDDARIPLANRANDWARALAAATGTAWENRSAPRNASGGFAAATARIFRVPDLSMPPPPSPSYRP